MSASKDAWDTVIKSSKVDVSIYDIIKYKFLSTQHGECFTYDKKLLLRNKSALDVADCVAAFIKDHITNPVITGSDYGSYVLQGKVKRSDDALVIIHARNEDEILPQGFVRKEKGGISETIIRIGISVISSRRGIKEILDHISISFKESETTSIKWWYEYGNNSVSYREVFLSTLNTKIVPEFYASMTCRDGSVVRNPHNHLREFLESDSAVLLLSGVPGTGKTTLIRHLISDFKLNAEIIYNEKLLSNDTVLQGFIFGESNLMIVEDADHVITSREFDANPLMSRFLNISDGVIKTPSKKLIFTTNILDFDKIDQALIRPGRCFDILHTRPLSYNQSCLAAQIANKPEPTEERYYTLAEVFNRVPSQ